MSNIATRASSLIRTLCGGEIDQYPRAARLMLIVFLALGIPLSGQGGEITACGLTIQRPEDLESINKLTIRLTETTGLNNIPVGDFSEMAAWTSEILQQAKSYETESGDITIEIRDTQLDYGQSRSFTHALIKSRYGYSWDPNSCGKRTDNPNAGTVSITLTDEMLEGTYSAALIRCEGDRAIATAAVSGRFECALPIVHDPLYQETVSAGEAYRTQAEAIWFSAGADERFEALERAAPMIKQSSRYDTPGTAATKQVGCDCSCPALLKYDITHPCRQSCGPQSLFDQCRSQERDLADEAAGNQQTDVCSQWERIQSGTGVPAALAPLIATISQGGKINCEEMSAAEKAEFEQMLQMMLGQ